MHKLNIAGSNPRARNAAGGGHKPAKMQSARKGGETVYYYFRLRGNIPPFTSDGTQALEEYFNAGEWTLEEIESELNRLNIKDISVYQIEE